MFLFLRAVAALAAVVLTGAIILLEAARWIAGSSLRWFQVPPQRATASVLLAALLVLPVMLAVGVQQQAAVLPIDVASIGSPSQLERVEQPAREQRVPIIRPGGRLDRTFPDGIPVGSGGEPLTQDDPLVTATLSLIASDAGLPDVFDALLDQSEPPYVLDDNYQPKSTYPYHYPRFHNLLEPRLTAEFVAHHREDLVELSSGLLFAGRAAPAYTILSLVKRHELSCDVQLNLALTVAIGFAPDPHDVDREFLAARRQCTEDPIAYVTHAKVVLAREIRGKGWPRSFYLGALGQEDNALKILHEGAETFPGHGALAAAEANILLDVADKYNSVRLHPFTSRWMYQRALALLDALVTAGTEDPTVDFARARALAGLGRDREALSVGGSALASLSTRDVNLGLTLPHQAALNLGDVQAALDTYPPPWHDLEAAVARRMCRSLINGNLAPSNPPETPQALAGATCYVVLVDATGGQFPSGADTFDYVDYIPQYRSGSVPLHLIETLAGRDHPTFSEADGEAQRRRYGALLSGRWDETIATHHVENAQDGLRRLGLLDEARAVLRTAMQHNLEPLSLWDDRLGEVAYLVGDHPRAVEHFLTADTPQGRQQFADWRQQEYWYREWNAGHDWSAIKAAASMHAANRNAEALELLASLSIPPAFDWQTDWTSAQLEIARSTLRGTLLTREGSHAEATDDFLRALDVCGLWHETDSDPCASGVQDNNLAVSFLQTGDLSDALHHARVAVAADPRNPMFVELVANVLEQQGDHAEALTVYREAIEADPTQVTALNNAGVILARQGENSEATVLFRRAVGAQPDYSLAWMNLAVALNEEDSFPGFLAAQAAWAEASRIERTNRGGAPEYVTDESIYTPGLDLSRPLPVDWSGGDSRTAPERHLTFGLIALSSLHVVKAVTQDKAVGWGTERALGVRLWSRRRLPRWIRSSWASVAVLVLAASYPLILSQGVTFTVVVLTVLVTALMGLAFLAARVLAGGTEPHSLSLGGAAVTAGLLLPLSGAFVSPPVLRNERQAGLVRWSPLLVLATVAVIAISCSELTRAPFIRGIGQTAVLLVGSALLAVPPFDGAALSRRGSAVVAVLLLVPTVFFAALWW